MKVKTDNKLLQALSGRPDTETLRAAAGAVDRMEAGFAGRFCPAGGPSGEPGDMDGWVYYALSGGGKRLRPILLFLCSGFGEGGDSAGGGALVPLMQAVELIHAASLVHDDIIDHSSMRHGKPTINAEKRDGWAARCGFAMVSEALGLLADLENDDIVALFADIPMEMCLGELLQIDVACRPELQGVAEYYGRIEKKTAKLIEGSCRAGGYLCGADMGTLDALTRYGHALGILFQLRDDLLDYDKKPGDGKPVAQDLERGVYSLPLLYALEQTAGTPEGERLRQVMAKNGKTGEELTFLLDMAERSGGVDFTRRAIREEAERASRALESLPQNGHRDLLATLLALLAPETGKPACLHSGENGTNSPCGCPAAAQERE